MSLGNVLKEKKKKGQDSEMRHDINYGRLSNLEWHLLFLIEANQGICEIVIIDYNMAVVDVNVHSLISYKNVDLGIVSVMMTELARLHATVGASNAWKIYQWIKINEMRERK